MLPARQARSCPGTLSQKPDKTSHTATSECRQTPKKSEIHQHERATGRQICNRTNQTGRRGKKAGWSKARPRVLWNPARPDRPRSEPRPPTRATTTSTEPSPRPRTTAPAQAREATGRALTGPNLAPQAQIRPESPPPSHRGHGRAAGHHRHLATQEHASGSRGAPASPAAALPRHHTP